MRILHVIHRYTPAIGGAERYMAAISEALVNTGHDVTVATTTALDYERIWRPMGARVPTPRQTHNGVDVHYFPVEYLPLPRLTYPAARLITAGLSRLIGQREVVDQLSGLTPRVPALDRWLTDPQQHDRFDLVAGMGITFEGLMVRAARFAQRQNLPFLLYPLAHLGSGRRPGSDSLSRFYTLPQQNRIAAEADVIMAMTPSEINYYTSHGIAQERLHQTGPGVDPDEIRGGDGRRFRAAYDLNNPIILALGGQTKEKGTLDLIKAMRTLWRTKVRANLVLAGAISRPVQALYDQLSEADKKSVVQLGPVNDRTKRDLLAAADIFCLPSRTESFGIVYLEAWLYQKPVIAAATWGIQGDVVEGNRDGLIVPFGQPNELARAIRRLLENPDLRQRLGQAGYQKVMRDHTWEAKMPRILAVYKEMAREEAR